jgi:nascent polypeptide-associated complex subunit alpha
MIPGMNPGQMRKMMQRMGIQQQEIDASEVIIKTADKNIIITNPSVTKVNMMGQETFQITGNVSESASEPEIDEEDIKTIVEQTGVSREKAVESLKGNDFDLAKTIIGLTQK